MAIHISEEQVCDVLSPALAFAAVKQAHIDLSAGIADNVVRSRARAQRMSLHILAAASDSLRLAAAKVYSATKGGVSSQVLLFNAESGELLATIEANMLGRRRTAAASAVAAAALLDTRECRIGIIGAGYQGLGLLEAFCDQSFPAKISCVSAFSRSADKRTAFCAQAKQLGIDVNCCDSSEEAVRNCDLLVLATTSSQPVVEESWLSEVSCICAIGSNALSRKELPARAVTASKIVVVDSIEAARQEAGDLLETIENEKLRWSQVIELGDLLRGASSRASSISTANYSLFCSQGLAVQDLYAAEAVYSQLKP